jgi:hypothetical protein
VARDPETEDNRSMAILERGSRLRTITRPVGHFFAWALLAAFYFAVLTPAGVLLRKLGKSPLACSFATRDTSYWVHRDGAGLSPLESQF